MEENEKWVPIPGFEESYEVSDLGRVRSIDRIVVHSNGRRQFVRGTILKPGGKKNHYRHVRLSGVSHNIHNLVLLAFVGPCPPDLERCHDDGDFNNNRLGNLYYGTHSQNCHDTVRHGTHHETLRKQCPRHHDLTLPNLVVACLKRGQRECLACSRAKAFFHNRKIPMEQSRLQSLSDEYYRRIVSSEPSWVTLFRS